MTVKTKNNPQLKEKVLSDGRVSLYLEYYYGRKETPILTDDGEPVLYTSGAMKGKPKYKVEHDRKKESLNLYYKARPRTPIEKREKEETLALAEKIRWERQQQFLEDKEGYRLKREQQAVNFIDYFQGYIDSYTKKDIRMMKIALQRFKDFLADTPEYKKYAKGIKPHLIDKDMMIDFTEYLQSRSKGTGAKTLYARFKKVVKYAVEHDVMKKNPCTGVSIKTDGERLVKDILSKEEIGALIETRIPRANQNIRRAFLFCLFAGLRFCDVKDLTFAGVDYSNKWLRFTQAKTEGHSTKSGVEIPLNDTLLELIGTPTNNDRDSLIFPLPSYEMCLKSVDRWVKKAGINKHITWHCARHSFAVNALNAGANIKTVSSLLGHSSLQHTEKYTRAVDQLKREAIDSLKVNLNKNENEDGQNI